MTIRSPGVEGRSRWATWQLVFTAVREGSAAHPALGVVRAALRDAAAAASGG